MHLLLRRGANPNASLAPMPVIFFAVQFGDVGMVRLLIERGADPNCHMPAKVRLTASAPFCPLNPNEYCNLCYNVRATRK